VSWIKFWITPHLKSNISTSNFISGMQFCFQYLIGHIYEVIWRCCHLTQHYSVSKFKFTPTLKPWYFQLNIVGKAKEETLTNFHKVFFMYPCIMGWCSLNSTCPWNQNISAKNAISLMQLCLQYYKRCILKDLCRLLHLPMHCGIIQFLINLSSKSIYFYLKVDFLTQFWKQY